MKSARASSNDGRPLPVSPSERRTSAPLITPRGETGFILTFQDVTEHLGLGFIHDSGAQGDFVMWEQMASGVALIDFKDQTMKDARDAFFKDNHRYLCIAIGQDQRTIFR